MTEPISEPGVYELTEDEYHADPVKGGSLSSTGARALLPPSCPARFHHDRVNGRADTAAFDHGHAAHALVLGIGAPIASLPFNDRRTNAYKDAVRQARTAGMTPLLAKDAEQVEDMAGALRAHPVAGPLFARPGMAELSLVYRDHDSGVMCRVRIDWMPNVDPDSRVLIVDYKTTTDAHPAAFARTMVKYGYHQQGPFYCDGITALGLDHCREPQFVLVAQEKTPPYLVTVGAPTPRALEWGRVLNRKARDIYRECVEADHWPGYSDAIEPLDIPGWLDNQYDDALDAGAFDTIGDLL